MSYVKHILQPDEHVVFDGRVHPIILVPGALMLGFAACIVLLGEGTGHGRSIMLAILHFFATYLHFLAGFYNSLTNWQQVNSNISFDLKVIAGIIAIWGFSKFMAAYLLMQTTELIVTDRRIIAKSGVTTVTTVEMDRRRIAGVTVYAPMMGRIFGYGYVMIQGFTSHIGGLPPMVNPHLVEKFVG